MSIRRVTVLQEASRAARELDAAAEMAAALEAELAGRFVEDTELLHFAALPFAREIGSRSAISRSMDPLAMERALRSKAAHARRALEAAAEAKPVRWSFSVVRGLVVDQLRAALSDADVVILATNGAHSSLSRQAAVMSADAHRSIATPALARLAGALTGRFDLVLLGADPAAVVRWEEAARRGQGDRTAPAAMRIRMVGGEEDLVRLVRALRKPERGPLSEVRLTEVKEGRR